MSKPIQATKKPFNPEIASVDFFNIDPTKIMIGEPQKKKSFDKVKKIDIEYFEIEFLYEYGPDEVGFFQFNLPEAYAKWGFSQWENEAVSKKGDNKGEKYTYYTYSITLLIEPEDPEYEKVRDQCYLVNKMLFDKFDTVKKKIGRGGLEYVDPDKQTQWIPFFKQKSDEENGGFIKNEAINFTPKVLTGTTMVKILGGLVVAPEKLLSCSFKAIPTIRVSHIYANKTQINCMAKLIKLFISSKIGAISKINTDDVVDEEQELLKGRAIDISAITDSISRVAVVEKSKDKDDSHSNDGNNNDDDPKPEAKRLTKEAKAGKMDQIRSFTAKGNAKPKTG
jgi:hypothetical protein